MQPVFVNRKHNTSGYMTRGIKTTVVFLRSSDREKGPTREMWN